MKLLTNDSFEKARIFVMEQGRELERRLLSYYFDDGTPAAVLDELASYQNQDGGFGNGLEPDIQMPDSSVITTTIALRILREVKATSDDEIVRRQSSICWPNTIRPRADGLSSRKRWMNIPMRRGGILRIRRILLAISWPILVRRSWAIYMNITSWHLQT